MDDYKLHYAQSLYQACFYQEAMKVTCQIENPEYQTQVNHRDYLIFINMLFVHYCCLFVLYVSFDFITLFYLPELHFCDM